MEKNRILPKTKIEAIRFNRYRGHKWDWIWIDYWPERLAEAIIKGKLGDKTILGLWVFLMGNGMHQMDIRRLIDKETNGNIHLMNKVKYLEKNLFEKKFDFGTYWDVNLQKKIRMVDSVVPPRVEPKKVVYRYIKPKFVYEGANAVVTDRFRQEDLADVFELISDGEEWLNDEPDAEVVLDDEYNAFFDDLEGMNLRFKRGSVFEADNSFVLVHCIAKDAIMGAGIAKIFKDKYPQMQEYIRNNNPNVGSVVYYKGIYNLITKNRSWDKPTKYNLQRSLISMKHDMKRRGIDRLAMPKIGSGLDQLNWSDTQRFIEYLFKNDDVIIDVYHL